MTKSRTKIILTFITVIFALVLFAATSFAATIGDVDGKDGIKAADARLALRAAVGLEALTQEQFTAADIDCSGDIKSSDARSILRAAVGLEQLKRNHKYSEWKTEREATCLKPGIKTRKCPCGENEIQELPTTMHSWSAWTLVNEPTQQKEGLEERICRNCFSVEKRAVEKLPEEPTTETPEQCKHSFGKWVIKTQPTCTKTGVRIRTCKCGATQSETIPATGNHSFGKWTIKTQATCSKTGTKVRACACGKTQSETIPATGNHAFGKWTIKTQATCTKTGTKIRSCECGKKETAVIPASHIFTIEKATVSQSKVCTRCKAVAEKSFNEYVNPIKAQPHIISYLSISENGSKVTKDTLKIDRTQLFLLLTTLGGYSAKEANAEINAMEKELKSGMNYTETENSTFYKNRTLTDNNFPIEGSKLVSELEEADVVSYTVEKADAVDFREFIGKTYTATSTGYEYDTSGYRYLKADNLIKLTVVLKTEKYSEIKDSGIEKTALMKATDIDMRELAKEVLEFSAGADMEGFATAVCNEITTNATIIVYIDTQNNAPVAACYNSSVICDPSISMDLMGMIEGTLDFTTDTNVTSLYFFDDYFA